MEVAYRSDRLPAEAGLVYKHENTLRAISMVFSTIVWLALLVGTVGIALVYALLFMLIYAFTQSAFISRIKGNGIRVTSEQFPDLHARLLHCCKAVGVDTEPECYLLRTDTFNALATRFFGRNFVVLYTDVVDALRDNPAALNFYIGHELGHIHRKHLRWSAFLLPSSVLPLLGAGYRRSQEYTCDRYGFASCESSTAAQLGVAAMGAGDSRYMQANAEALATQNGSRASFWMSFHELISDYPWLTKRMSQINSLSKGTEPESYRRNPFAWLLAVFIPRAGVGGAGSLIVVVAIIGILAAIAIPAYQDYTVRSQVTQGLNAASGFKAAVVDYAVRNQQWPSSVEDMTEGAPSVPAALAAAADVSISEGGLITVTLKSGPLTGKGLRLEPQVENEEVVWRCSSNEIELKHLPQACR